MPSRSNLPPPPVAFVHHLHLDDSGYAQWRPGTEAQVTEIGFMGEEPERALSLQCVTDNRGTHPIELSSLYLSLIWPRLHSLAIDFTASDRDVFVIHGPPRGILVLSGMRR